MERQRLWPYISVAGLGSLPNCRTPRLAQRPHGAHEVKCMTEPLPPEMVQEKIAKLREKLLPQPVFKSPKTLSGKPFTGILLEPIMTPFVPAPLGKDPQQDERIERFAREVTDKANEALMKRIVALADHYEIDLDEQDAGEVLFGIVIKMGRDFLPGFQLNLNKPTTRPPNSHKIGGQELLEAVNKRRNENNETVKQACAYLHRKGPNQMKHAGIENLEAAYYVFVKKTKDADEFVRLDDYYSRVILEVGLDEINEQLNKITKVSTG
jgi:hypothetical protein